MAGRPGAGAPDQGSAFGAASGPGPAAGLFAAGGVAAGVGVSAGAVLVGLGVDVVEVDRIAAVLARYGQRFLRRLFSEQEAARCGRRRHGQQEACLAGRFAAKEAVMKALGTGTRGVAYREIEVASLPGGRPTVRLYGRALARARQLGVERVAISITHGRDVAVAVAVALARAAGGPAGGAGDASGEGA